MLLCGTLGMKTVKTKKTREEVLRIIREMPLILAGKKSDPDKLRETFLAYWAKAFFTQVHAAFVQKSNGGTDQFNYSWAPLNKAYKRWKEKKLGHSRILIFTGLLEESLRPGKVSGSSYEPSRNQTFKMTPKGAVLGTTVPYAKYHQLGTQRIPQRKFWPDKNQLKVWYKKANREATARLTIHLLKKLR